MSGLFDDFQEDVFPVCDSSCIQQRGILTFGEVHGV